MSDFPLPRFGARVEDTPLGAPETLVPPIAEFSSAPTGLSVQFTDLSSDPEGGQIVAWEWDFGDTGAAPPPTANFTFNIQGLAVQFTDTSTAVSPKTITTRSWNFGDGSTSSSATPGHTYAAAGTYNATLLVTDSGGVSAFKQRTVVISQAGGNGQPFCLFAFWQTATAPKANAHPIFNGSCDGISPNQVASRINAARNLNHHMVMNMTGGSHDNYLTGGQFDFNKWKNVMNGFNTSAIKAAVAAGVEDGTVQGASVMDEPTHPTWNDSVSKAILDQMWQYVHDIFPTLPVGVVEGGNDDGWPGTYQKMDWVGYSMLWRRPTGSEGNIPLWRSHILAIAAQQGVRPVFIMNPLDGGIRAPEEPDAAGCPLPLTGGPGTGGPNCRETAAQLENWGLQLTPYGVGMLVWRYDASQMSSTAYRNAFQALRNDLNGRPVIPWYRP